MGWLRRRLARGRRQTGGMGNGGGRGIEKGLRRHLTGHLDGGLTRLMGTWHLTQRPRGAAGPGHVLQHLLHLSDPEKGWMDLIGVGREGLRKKGMRRGEGIDAVARMGGLRIGWRGKRRKLLLLLLLLLLLRDELLMHVMQSGGERRLRRMMSLELVEGGGGFGVGSRKLQPQRSWKVRIKLHTLQ